MEATGSDGQQDFLPEGLLRAPNVLVVDDDPNVCKLLEYHLKRAGCDVSIANSGEAALESLNDGHLIDVVLLDFRLPGITGLETLRRINHRNKPASVIVMTAHGTTEEAVACLKEGAYDYVRKTNGLDNLRMAMRNALETVGLKEEVEQLRAKLVEKDHHFPDIVSRSPAMTQVKKLVRMVSSRDITILLEGESGSGKELIARAIHTHGDYRDKPFVAINCAAIPEALLESELFGHERGAFTGAISRRIGKFEEAQGGTLLLDEVGELNPSLQAKLLRVLQTKEIQPVGGRTRKVNVRIISATNRDLGDSVRKGLFRHDLYYRLAVFPILLPSLRERKEDILELAQFFLRRFAGHEESPVTGLTREVEQALLDYDWPGNVRELENIIYRAVVLSESELLQLRDFPVLAISAATTPPPAPPALSAASPSPPEVPVRARVVSLEQLEAQAIRQALESTAGNVSRAAELLHISRATLYRKSKKFQIPLR